MQKIFCVFLLVVVLAFVLVIVAPLVSFGKPYADVCLDAASLYGINEDEYVIEFRDELSLNGNPVYGLYYGTRTIDGTAKHYIEIKNSIIRPLVIETIFHELAHAAQRKYNLDFGNYTIEQHAEILSFSMMWNNGYQWDAFHLVPTHVLHAKSAEYRVSDELISIVGGTSNIVYANFTAA